MRKARQFVSILIAASIAISAVCIVDGLAIEVFGYSKKLDQNALAIQNASANSIEPLIPTKDSGPLTMSGGVESPAQPWVFLIFFSCFIGMIGAGWIRRQKQ